MVHSHKWGAGDVVFEEIAVILLRDGEAFGRVLRSLDSKEDHILSAEAAYAMLPGFLLLIFSALSRINLGLPSNLVGSDNE